MDTGSLPRCSMLIHVLDGVGYREIVQYIFNISFLSELGKTLVAVFFVPTSGGGGGVRGEGCGVVARMSVYQYRGGTGRSIMGRVEGGAAVCAHHLVRV